MRPSNAAIATPYRSPAHGAPVAMASAKSGMPIHRTVPYVSGAQSNMNNAPIVSRFVLKDAMSGGGS